eukprot:10457004-Alexandrium_andersonii.AAC.1
MAEETPDQLLSRPGSLIQAMMEQWQAGGVMAPRGRSTRSCRPSTRPGAPSSLGRPRGQPGRQASHRPVG